MEIITGACLQCLTTSRELRYGRSARSALGACSMAANGMNFQNRRGNASADIEERIAAKPNSEAHKLSYWAEFLAMISNTIESERE